MPDGSQARDVCAMYSVILPEERIGELEAVLREFRSGTLQVAIYLEIQRSAETRFLV